MGKTHPSLLYLFFDSRIGTTLLLLQCLEPILLDVDSKNDQKAALASKSHYIYLLLELCASDEFQISDCALQIFNKYKQKHPDIFEIHLNRYDSTYRHVGDKSNGDKNIDDKTFLVLCQNYYENFAKLNIIQNLVMFYLCLLIRLVMTHSNL